MDLGRDASERSVTGGVECVVLDYIGTVSEIIVPTRTWAAAVPGAVGGRGHGGV